MIHFPILVSSFSLVCISLAIDGNFIRSSTILTTNFLRGSGISSSTWLPCSLVEITNLGTLSFLFPCSILGDWDGNISVLTDYTFCPSPCCSSTHSSTLLLCLGVLCRSDFSFKGLLNGDTFDSILLFLESISLYGDLVEVSSLGFGLLFLSIFL